MNHRLLQKTLFRMLLDEGFRARVLGGDREAEPALEEAEFALLAELDPAALGADRGDSRRRQALGNLLGEFALTVAFAPESWAVRGLSNAFFSSSEFHRAIRADEALPLAFASYLEARFAQGSGLARDILRLEIAMLRCRRDRTAAPALAAGEVLLAPGQRLHEAPEGLAALAAAARVAIAEGRPPERPAPGRARPGRLLLSRRPGDNPHALPEVLVEELSPAVAGLLELARQPLGLEGRVAFAAALGADAETVESFCAELVGDGVLLRSR